MSALLKSSYLQKAMKVPPSYIVFIALVLVLWSARPNMFNAHVMGILVRQDAPLGVLVLGQLLVMRVRSIDLSGGGIILLVNYLITADIFPGAHLLFFAVMAIAIGTPVGLFNGLMVAKRRVSAVIVTLAVSIILVGIVQFLAGGSPPGDVPPNFAAVYNTGLGPVPTPVLFWAALAVAMSLLLSRTVFGRFVATVGENAQAANFSGVPVERTVVAAHAIAGAIAAVAALVQTASLGVGSVSIGLDLPILAVAATILGGVVFGRGEGGVWGPTFGVLSFAFLFIVMTVFGIPEPGKQIAQGLIILLAAIFYGVRSVRPN